MGNFTVNMIFAVVFAGFAWNSLPRGWRFFRVGYEAVKSNIHTPTERGKIDVERQRDVQQGTNFLIAGTAWLFGGIISAVIAITLVAFAFLNMGIFNLLS